MRETPPFEIPEAVRDMAERNVEQARTAYMQFLDMTRQAQEAVAKSSDVMAESAREIQNRTLRYAQDHVNASFSLATDLARARDIKDYLDIQTQFAQRQMKTYADQAQELGRLMAEMTKKAQPPR